MSQPTPLQETALDHLRVIRTLMDRANIYRAVSASAALVGGLLSLALAVYGFRNNDFFTNGGALAAKSAFREKEFLFSWIGVLVVTSVVNIVLLMRGAHDKGQPAVTDGLKMALRALGPPMLCGGIMGSYLIWTDLDIAFGTIIWILCYGLALQATVSFAPRSIVWLARAFLITGQALAIFYFLKGGLGMFQRKEAPASLFMGLTFGLYHIIYAVAVYCSKPRPSSQIAD
jgi:hypothetical protein